MVSRCIAILACSLLPMFAAALPLSPAHEANLMVSGILATLLSLGSLFDNRARFATAVIGGWVALSPFVFASTRLEEVVAVSLGVPIFVFIMGPFSEAPRVSFTRAPAATAVVPEGEPKLARAA